MKDMSFSDALDRMRANPGTKIARAGWNGKGMWLTYASGGMFKDAEGLVQGDLIEHIVMKTADDKFVPWLASQSDLLSYDWEIV
jgi:hypothetical protein